MIYKMKNSIQHYHWGNTDYLPDLLGIDNKKQKPFAELWMGAHPKASSSILMPNGYQPLDKLIDSNEKLLPRGIRDQFQGFPYLFKILSIASPLSIQVHPSISQAHEGFKKEEEKHIALDDTERNYKDKNHKPEIIYAISDFWALKGFRKFSEIKENLLSLSSELYRDLDRMEQEKQPLSSFFAWLMNLEIEKKNLLFARVESHLEDSVKKEWVQTLMSYYPGDISSLAPLYLNLIHLNPGEALFQKAGELHAYLKGNGVELMANSDNVLRGGLTSKHMDLKELQRVVNFNTSTTEKVPFRNGYYDSPVKDFKLGELRGFKDEKIKLSSSPAVLLNLGEDLTVEDKKNSRCTIVKKGASVYIDSESRDLRLMSKKGWCFWALPGVES